MLATQRKNLVNGTDQVNWVHRNPITASQRTTDSNGNDAGISSEPDPFGANAGLTKPPAEGFASVGVSDVLMPFKYADVYNGSTGCTMDGAMVSCDFANMPEGSYEVLPEGVSPGANPLYNPKTGKTVIGVLGHNPDNGELGFWGHSRVKTTVTPLDENGNPDGPSEIQLCNTTSFICFKSCRKSRIFVEDKTLLTKCAR